MDVIHVSASFMLRAHCPGKVETDNHKNAKAHAGENPASMVSSEDL